MPLQGFYILTHEPKAFTMRDGQDSNPKMNVKTMSSIFPAGNSKKTASYWKKFSVLMKGK
jgi:hypothetical protein